MGKANINRPVHLALRDRYYGEFMGLLRYSFEGRSLKFRIRLINFLFDKMEMAYKEAKLALKGIVASQQEYDFVKFLRMVLDGTQVVKFLVEHEEILRQDTSFLKRFLQFSPEMVSESRVSHQAGAEQILKQIKIMIGIAERGYRQLRENDLRSFDKDEKRRYSLMFRSEYS